MKRAVLILGLALVGCAEEAPPAEEVQVEAPAQVEAPSADPEGAADSPADPRTPEAQVPVEEDFASASTTEVTLENYEAELDRIERELRAEGVDVRAHPR